MANGGLGKDVGNQIFKDKVWKMRLICVHAVGRFHWSVRSMELSGWSIVS